MTTWTHDGRTLHVAEGSPTMFCYSDGEYLGSRLKMEDARRLCLAGKRENYVMEMETVDEALEKLPKAARLKLTWKQLDKSNWSASVEGEKLPARIRMLDAKTHAVYRDGRYLGSEKNLDDAKKRAVVNELSQRNAVMRLWEQTHPDELPPGLQLTEEERAEYWRRHPPTAKAAPRVGRAAAAARPDEDPQTRKLREALAAEAGNRKPGRTREAQPDAPQGTIRIKGGALIPKKPGSSAHGRWSVLWAHDGKTVAEYAKAGGNLTTLANAIGKGLVRVEVSK